MTPSLLSHFLLLLLLSSSPILSLSSSLQSQVPKTHIVLIDPNLKPSHLPSLHHWYSSTLHSLSQFEEETDTISHPPKILHTYNTALHGFSSTLTPSQASLLRSRPFVVSVFPDRVRKLHTTRSPSFLGLTGPNSGAMAASRAGDGVVIAVLDSGVDPKHRSFGDDGLGEVRPGKWKGRCDVGPGFPERSCNRKLVGARFFPAGFKAAASATNATTADIMSPLDTDGHGTHTASTAAGRSSPHASLFNYAAGTASGIAPNARVAVYKVCWSSGCFDSDILAAIDTAVADGADVISLSVGSAPTPYQSDPIAIATFAAVSQGVFVSASAGNDGPGEMTVTNIAPWIATIGAGSIDRDFPTDVILGDGAIIPGTSLYSGPTDNRYYPLVTAANVSTSRIGFRSAAPFCMHESLDPEATHGKVVLCERGAVSRVEKGLAVKEAGGAGMIVANQLIDGEGLVPDAHLIPAAGIGAEDGFNIHAYIANEKEPRVRLSFRGTRLGVKPAPMVASFSGRGPSAESAYIIKPDLIAPGAGILAAWTENVGPTGLAADTRRTEFNILSGTSMACPHVSGIAALLKAAHPDWSPAAIKSALMTSASVTDNLGNDIHDDSSGNTSTGWAMGSGYVNPEKAINPGLIYDIAVDEYIQFLCSSKYAPKDIRTIARRPVNCSRNSLIAPWDLNYPSISVVMELSENVAKLEVKVHREVTNVGENATEYTASVQNPSGAVVEVQPTKLSFNQKGEKLGFLVRIAAENVLGLKSGDSRTEFGSLTWNNGKHVVRSPIGVTWQQY